MSTNVDTAVVCETLAPEIGEDRTLDSTLSVPASPSIWRNRNFNLFWAGQTFDALGDASVTIIFPLLVLEATGSVAQMGFVTGTMGISSLIGSLFSGVIVDRVDRRKLMILCDVGRALIYGLIPVSWLLFGPSTFVIYLVTVVTSILTTNFIVAYATVVPNIVAKEHISHANGRLQSTAAMAYVAGPVIAGLASATLTASAAICMISLSYVVSAVFMILVRLNRKTEVPREAPTKTSSLDGLLAGVRFLLRHPMLRPVVLTLAAFVLVEGAAVDLSIYRLKNELGQDDHTLGIVFGIASMGSICAGVLTPVLRRKWGFGLCFLGSICLQAVAIGSIALAPSAAILAAFATSYTFGLTVRNICSMSLRQQITPDHLLGRVTSALWTIILVLGPIGTAVATAFAERVGTQPVFICLGVSGVLIATLGSLTAARRREPEKEAYPETPTAAEGAA